MGRIKEIDMVLRNTEESLGSVEDKLDRLLHLMQDMVRLEGKIQSLEEKIDGKVDKLTDRLVEMAMVKSGDTQAAVQHRAQSRLETNDFSNQESWDENEAKEEPWPPPGCNVMESIG
jgi:hypothetical protein